MISINIRAVAAQQFDLLIEAAESIAIVKDATVIAVKPRSLAIPCQTG